MDILFIQNLGPQGYVNLKFQISDAICKMLAFTLEFHIPHFKVCWRYPLTYGNLNSIKWMLNFRFASETSDFASELQIMHLKFQTMYLSLQIMHLSFQIRHLNFQIMHWMSLNGLSYWLSLRWFIHAVKLHFTPVGYSLLEMHVAYNILPVYTNFCLSGKNSVCLPQVLTQCN